MARIESGRGVTGFISSSDGSVDVFSSLDLVNTDKSYHIRTTNSDLIFSSSATSYTVVSGNLKVLGALSASGTEIVQDVTGSTNFFVTNRLDSQGVLLNSSGSLILSSSNGSNVYLSGTFEISGSSGSFSGFGINVAAVSEDVPAKNFDIHAGNSFFSSSVNIFGGDLHLVAGLGVHKLTILNYTLLSGINVQVAVNITNNIRSEGVHWTASTDNDITAASLGSALSSIDGIIVYVSSSYIFVRPKSDYIRAISITSNASSAGLSGAYTTGGPNDGLIKIYQDIEAGHNLLNIRVRNPWSGGNSQPMLTLDRADENVIVKCWSLQTTSIVGGTSPGLILRTNKDILFCNGGTGGASSGRNNYVFSDWDKRHTDHLLSVSSSPTIHIFASGNDLLKYVSLHYSGTQGGMLSSNSGSLYLVGRDRLILSSSNGSNITLSASSLKIDGGLSTSPATLTHGINGSLSIVASAGILFSNATTFNGTTNNFVGSGGRSLGISSLNGTPQIAGFNVHTILSSSVESIVAFSSSLNFANADKSYHIRAVNSNLILSSSAGSISTFSGTFRSTGYSSASLPNPTTVQSGTITFVSDLNFYAIASNGVWNRILTGSF